VLDLHEPDLGQPLEVGRHRGLADPERGHDLLDGHRLAAARQQRHQLHASAVSERAEPRGVLLGRAPVERFHCIHR